MKTRIPPQSTDSEKAVLGSMMQDEMAAITVLGMLTEECFYLDAHRYVFRAMVELKKESQPIDQLTVMQKLVDLKLLNDVGGAVMIADIINRVPTARNAEHYANVVKDKYIKRLIIKNANEIVDNAYEEKDELLKDIDEFQTKILSLGSGDTNDHSVQSLCNAGFNVGEAFKTGFNKFDSLFGGLWKQDLVIIAGTTSMGKTSCAMSFMLSLSKNKIPVSYFSLEMSKDAVFGRLLSMEGRVDHHNIRTGNLNASERYKIEVATEKLMSYPIHINTKAGWTIADIRSKIRKLHHHGKCEVAFIDYIDYMNMGGSNDRHDLKIEQITSGLKGLAKELDITIVLLSQLSRKPDEREDHRPRLSDLKNSSAIEQNADMVLFPYRNYKYTMNESEKNNAELIVAKNRNGSIGVLKDYVFYGDRVTYAEVETFTF